MTAVFEWFTKFCDFLLSFTTLELFGEPRYDVDPQKYVTLKIILQWPMSDEFPCWPPLHCVMMIEQSVCSIPVVCGFLDFWSLQFYKRELKKQDMENISFFPSFRCIINFLLITNCFPQSGKVSYLGIKSAEKCYFYYGMLISWLMDKKYVNSILTHAFKTSISYLRLLHAGDNVSFN